MCPQCVFRKILQFWFFYEYFKKLRRASFFTAYSVDVGDFLPHTQQTQEIFYSILSSRRRFFTEYSVDVGDFLPHTQQTQEIFYRILSRSGLISKICHPALLCQLSRLGIFFYPILSTHRRFFTAYSVHVGDFYRILSTRRRFFTAYSVHVA